jgi:hypothetical protein
LDYACEGTRSLDFINLVINFNGTTRKELNNIDGGTGCLPYESIPARIIRPAKSWYHVTNDDYIFFDQVTTREAFGGNVWKMSQNSTIRNPVRFDKLSYNCVIFGDGKEQHFGTNFTQHEPARVYLKCDLASVQSVLQ